MGHLLIATGTGIIHLDCSPGRSCIFLSLSSRIYPHVRHILFSNFFSLCTVLAQANTVLFTPVLSTLFLLLSGSPTGQSMDLGVLKSNSPRAVFFKITPSLSFMIHLSMYILLKGCYDN